MGVVLISQFCYAQTPLSVFGINPNTTMKKFNLALSNKGFKPYKITDGHYYYKVTYAGYPDCDMEVKHNSGNDSILLINIYLPHESIAKDEIIYMSLTQQFKEKYGNEFDWNQDIFDLVFKTQKMKSYGKFRVNLCHVVWYFNDEKEEDGVHVQYETNARADGNVKVNSDI